MPPQLLELLKVRRNQIILASVAGVIIIVLIITGIMGANHKGEGSARKLNENEMVLATVDTMGKAIEIEALLAREKVNVMREDIEGGKASIKFLPDATTDDRDKALITLVQSGLMDKNVGLEVFDKGDLTASREEKRIKLVRARNGELARLIRKIEPIQDASVFISMPEPTIFKQDMQPISATIQVTLDPGERLNRDKVRSIINLMVGSIENLDAKHVSLTDTNGNVYNSVLDPTDELTDKLEERDRYMEQKVRVQLDRLLGQNKYVATVSTYLREAPKSEMTMNYAPQMSSVAKSSTFHETLNSQQKGGGSAGGPASTYIPPGIDTSTSNESDAHRGYNRNGLEIEYSNGKRQVTEDFVPGMVEEITVAVTVDASAYPGNMPIEEFKNLVAHTASPLVRPENVMIVKGRPEEISTILPPKTNKLAIPWWAWVLGGLLLFIFFMSVLKAMLKPSVNPQWIEQQQQEIDQLRELANNQAQQIQMTQQQAQQVIQSQQQQIAQLSSQQQPQQQQASPQVQDSAQELKQTLSELQQAISKDEDDETAGEALGSEIKSWIESAG
jgi:flagellar M-ring protein FliF